MFYTELFSRDHIDLRSQCALFSYVTSRLSEPEQASCEGPLSLTEASEALRLSNRNKTPGPNGLLVEFYAHFWQKLGEVLVLVFNLAIVQGDLLSSMKASVTRLVHKKDDKRNLKNWRPISLLNVDYKICSKAISLRLAKALGSIVDPDQTCSVPGRSISSNLVLLRDTLAFIECTNEKGILVSLDQEKAFDRLDRTFLLNLLELFGFGPWFRNCIANLYKGSYIQVLVNDFLSDPIPLARGVRQGDALSPMLYILCVEVLACKMRLKVLSSRALVAYNLKSPSVPMIPQHLLKMKDHYLHFLKPFRTLNVALEPNLTEPRRRPCGWGPGRTGRTSHWVSHG